jgi:hypothetical protein
MRRNAALGFLAMSPGAIVLIILVAAVVIALVVMAAKAHAERERQRKLALAQWASANGFSFSEQDPFDLDARFRGVGAIGNGHSRYAYEVLSRNDPLPCFIFQYHYATTETRTVTHTNSDGSTSTRTETYEQDHYCQYLILEMGAQFPSLAIRLEGLFDKIKGLFGFDDINFESEAFSRKYHVKSDHREFAYAVIHPQMMEWMLQQDVQFMLQNGRLLMDIGKLPHTGEGCSTALAVVNGFVNRIPAFVWKDYGHREPVTLPDIHQPPPPTPATQPT